MVGGVGSAGRCRIGWRCRVGRRIRSNNAGVTDRGDDGDENGLPWLAFSLSTWPMVAIDRLLSWRHSADTAGPCVQKQGDSADECMMLGWWKGLVAASSSSFNSGELAAPVRAGWAGHQE